jgi:hypothetical protein
MDQSMPPASAPGAGFASLERVAETPFNLVLEAKP